MQPQLGLRLSGALNPNISTVYAEEASKESQISIDDKAETSDLGPCEEGSPAFSSESSRPAVLAFGKTGGMFGRRFPESREFLHAYVRGERDVLEPNAYLLIVALSRWSLFEEWLSMQRAMDYRLRATYGTASRPPILWQKHQTASHQVRYAPTRPFLCPR